MRCKRCKKSERACGLARSLADRSEDPVRASTFDLHRDPTGGTELAAPNENERRRFFGGQNEDALAAAAALLPAGQSARSGASLTITSMRRCHRRRDVL